MSSPRIHIIGAGVSGLVCAIELERAGYSPVIIEASDEVGGRLQTDMYEGLPLDHGFQVMLTAYPAVRRYLDTAKLELHAFRPGAIIFKNGRKIRFGDFMRDSSFFPSTLTTTMASIKDKLNTYLLSKRLRSKNAETIFDNSPGSTMGYLESKGFSKSMIRSFFVPFYGGIFLEKELETPASMFAFTFKMFSEGEAAIPRNGIHEIAVHLKDKLKSTSMEFNTRVESVKTGEITLQDGQKILTDAVVWTCPPKELEPEITWRSCSTYYFNTNNNVLNDNIIGLLPDAEVVNSFHYITDVFGPHETDAHVLSATVVGRTDAPIDQVVRDLQEHCGMTDLDHIKTIKVEHALPNVTMATYAPDASKVKVTSGIYRAGDTMANASLNAAMESGRVAARAVIDDLHEMSS